MINEQHSGALNHKSISILAVIFIVIEAIPVVATHPNPVIFVKIALWLTGAVFIWMKQSWAAIFLAVLALFYLATDILFQIPRMISAIGNLSARQVHPYLPYLIGLSMIIEIAFLSSFIYYGFTVLRNRTR